LRSSWVQFIPHNSWFLLFILHNSWLPIFTHLKTTCNRTMYVAVLLMMSFSLKARCSTQW
jgi:hypothetical protein